MFCSFWTIVCLLLVIHWASARRGFGPGEQDWGYVDVREGAHMFYWLYYTTANVSTHTERPLVLWLQGGPRGASSALGNFRELGPVDLKGEPREGNWVQHVNLLLIDNPLGAGFSYVENSSLLVTNNEELTDDLMTFMMHFYSRHSEFKEVPLHIFSESYGGKMAPALAIRLDKAMRLGELAAPGILRSVTLGNPWISPRHVCKEYSRYLFVNGLIDEDGVAQVDATVNRILEALDDHEFKKATDGYFSWLRLMQELTGEVFSYNTQTHVDPTEDRSYGYGEDIIQFMEDIVSEALQINGSVFSAQAILAHDNLYADSSVATIDDVPLLLNETSIKVNIYSGQLDIIVPTPATLALIKDWAWINKTQYLQAKRTPLVIAGKLQGYEKVGGKFGMYWINRPGHLVPGDNPVAMEYVLNAVTQYGSGSSI